MFGPGAADIQDMSAHLPSPAASKAETTLVLAMLANRIPLTLLPDLAWLTGVATTDFVGAGRPC
jgi:hypothetical protein